MKIAIVHYHLNRGGVNQVIANHIAALASIAGRSPVDEVSILFGGRRKGWNVSDSSSPRVSLVEVEGLDYDTGPVRSRELADRLRETLKRIGFSPSESVLHVHNHALGKNVSLPGALSELAGDGFALLMHIHDFTEDFRPDNYRALRERLAPDLPSESSQKELAQKLYPVGGRVHYAVLNRRDERVLRAAGVSSERLHLLPNPVMPPCQLPDRESARHRLSQRLGIAPEVPLLVYPVRGIRRKNIGEVLLWSGLARDRARVAITLAPINPLEESHYRVWKDFARTEDLGCEFELSDRSGLDFPEIQSAADRILTTSVAEGFGMVFLETWLVQRELVGRDLPEITSDFVDSGVNLGNLHNEFWVPVDWIGESTFLDGLEGAFRDVLHQYGIAVPPARTLREASAARIVNGWIDFGACSSAAQRTILHHVLEDARSLERLQEQNPWVAEHMASQGVDQQLVTANASAVREGYSLARSGDRLIAIYEQVLHRLGSDSIGPLPDARSILPHFLDISRFHPLRTES